MLRDFLLLGLGFPLCVVAGCFSDNPVGALDSESGSGSQGGDSSSSQDGSSGDIETDGTGETGGSDTDEPGETDPPVTCQSSGDPEFVAEGTVGPEFSIGVGYFDVGPDGLVIHEQGGSVDLAISRPNEEVELVEDAYLPGTGISPRGRWLSISLGEGATASTEVRDLELGETYTVPIGTSGLSYYEDPNGQEAVVLSRNEIWVVDGQGPRQLEGATNNLDAGPRGFMAVDVGDSGPRVFDLDSGDSQALGRGLGTAQISRDGTLVVFAPQAAQLSLEFVDAETLETVAEAAVGHNRARHAPGTAHSMAFAGVDGGVVFIDETNEVHSHGTGELYAVVGARGAVMHEANTLHRLDLIDGTQTALSGVTDVPSLLTVNDVRSVESSQSRALAVSVLVNGQRCVVSAHEDSPDLVPVLCSGSDLLNPAFVGNDGVTVTYETLSASETRFDVFDPDGVHLETFERPGRDAEPVFEHGGLAFIRVWGGAGNGALIEVDLLTGEHREVVKGDRFGMGVGGADCLGALSRGCASDPNLPDTGLFVDWELFRFPIGGSLEALPGPC